ncbi:MAG: hypothetical protein JF616_15870 [Fibrobacteres bacterium]|jgi:hypothetical protein|nr:hypothetical protein [Fibrobacterota bacterium]
MEEFLLLVRGYDYNGVSPEIMQQRMNAYRPWMEKMTAAGRYKGGNPLEPGTGRLLKDKRTVLTDGPFLESKDIIGGYVILLAKDYDEAVGLVKDCPLLDHCQLEVRKLGPKM